MKGGNEFLKSGLDIPPIPGRNVKPNEYEKAFETFIIKVFGEKIMAEQVSSLKTGIKYKDTPIGKIPVDWEVVRLKEHCNGESTIGANSLDTTNIDYWNGSIPWITGADIRESES